ncbi:hypothetical protein SUGI_0530610 [Cryptomeria japonica]|nr:hypothetical protein SUGI_0530610 [Cryptomeria japonica]
MLLAAIVGRLLDGKAFTGEIPHTLDLVESLEGLPATIAIDEIPPILYSLSESAPLFDGTTGIYNNLACPYAQRDRPTWYKKKVYPPNKDTAKKEAANELLKYRETF